MIFSKFLPSCWSQDMIDKPAWVSLGDLRFQFKLFWWKWRVLRTFNSCWCSQSTLWLKRYHIDNAHCVENKYLFQVYSWFSVGIRYFHLRSIVVIGLRLIYITCFKPPMKRKRRSPSWKNISLVSEKNQCKRSLSSM